MNWGILLLCAGGVIMLSMSIGWYVFWSRVFRSLEQEEKTYELLAMGEREKRRSHKDPQA